MDYLNTHVYTQEEYYHCSKVHIGEYSDTTSEEGDNDVLDKIYNDNRPPPIILPSVSQPKVKCEKLNFRKAVLADKIETETVTKKVENEKEIFGKFYAFVPPESKVSQNSVAQLNQIDKIQIKSKKTSSKKTKRTKNKSNSTDNGSKNQSLVNSKKNGSKIKEAEFKTVKSKSKKRRKSTVDEPDCLATSNSFDLLKNEDDDNEDDDTEDELQNEEIVHTNNCDVEIQITETEKIKKSNSGLSSNVTRIHDNNEINLHTKLIASSSTSPTHNVNPRSNSLSKLNVADCTETTTSSTLPVKKVKSKSNVPNSKLTGADCTKTATSSVLPVPKVKSKSNVAHSNLKGAHCMETASSTLPDKKSRSNLTDADYIKTAAFGGAKSSVSNRTIDTHKSVPNLFHAELASSLQEHHARNIAHIEKHIAEHLSTKIGNKSLSDAMFGEELKKVLPDISEAQFENMIKNAIHFQQLLDPNRKSNLTGAGSARSNHEREKLFTECLVHENHSKTTIETKTISKLTQSTYSVTNSRTSTFTEEHSVKSNKEKLSRKSFQIINGNDAANKGETTNETSFSRIEVDYLEVEPQSGKQKSRRRRKKKNKEIIDEIIEISKAVGNLNVPKRRNLTEVEKVYAEFMAQDIQQFSSCRSILDAEFCELLNNTHATASFAEPLISYDFSNEAFFIPTWTDSRFEGVQIEKSIVKKVETEEDFNQLILSITHFEEAHDEGKPLRCPFYVFEYFRNTELFDNSITNDVNLVTEIFNLIFGVLILLFLVLSIQYLVAFLCVAKDYFIPKTVVEKATCKKLLFNFIKDIFKDKTVVQERGVWTSINEFLFPPQIEEKSSIFLVCIWNPLLYLIHILSFYISQLLF